MAEHTVLKLDEFNSLLIYLQSIDWKDPWLIGLIFFHVAVTLTSILTRNHGNIQTVLFLVLIVLVYFSENLNKIAAENWNVFSRQQYFDSNGMFISIVFCAPILLNCMVLVASWLYQSSQLMTQLKIAQLQHRIKMEKIKKKNGNFGDRHTGSVLLEPTMDATGIQEPKLKDD